MFGRQSKTEAAKEILAFTATASPAARARIQAALQNGMSAQQVAKSIRNAEAIARTRRLDDQDRF
jgi:ribosomal protein L22